MKKSFYILLLSVSVILFSCRDDSGKFEEQLFTISQMSTAIRQCITISSDSTMNTLCIVDSINQKYGYYYFDENSYRITLPAAAQQVVDTLTEYGFGETIEKLISDINVAAEQCGYNIKRDFFTPFVESTTFSHPYDLIYNDSYSAITDYVQSIKQMDFITILSTSILNDQFDDLNINTRWELLLKEYNNITDKYVSIELLPDVSKKMVNGFFTVMSTVEEEIRKNPELRGEKSSMLYLVFATLDE